jgi:hypothetical protein
MPVEELRSLLSAAVRDGEPPAGDGPSAVFARARQIRRRRQVAMSFSIAGIVAAVGVTMGLVLPTRHAGPEAAYDLALQPLARADVSDSPRLALVKSLLPADLKVSDATEARSDEHPWIRGQMVVTDAGGQTVLVYVVVEDTDLTPYRSCESGQVRCEKQYRYAGDRIADCAEALQSTRLLVSVCAMNAFPVRGENPGPVTRPTPALTRDQLEAIANDPHWSMR